MKVRGVDLGRGIALEPVVEGDDVQHVEVLALVLVDAFHLDVEERVRVDRDAGPLQDQRGQSLSCCPP